MKKPKLITVTDLALSKMQANILKRDKPSLGIRIEVRGKGCSGMSYTMEFCDKTELGDEIVELDGMNIYIDPKSILFLIGLEIDYKEDMFKSGFSFSNPNAKGSCGCGESFHV
jgi:iron-sulfur cluster assembly protein